MSKDTRRNVTWVEGVRGVASFLVVITHLSRAFDYPLFWPADDDETPPRLLQLPILRLLVQGRIGVMMFAFLTGYVCAIKPLRQVKSGNTSAALTTLAKSAFRRPPRLVLPATLALIIAWTVAQYDGFGTATRCDSEWLRGSSVKVEPSLAVEIPRFFHEYRKMWLTPGPSAAYDEHTWALEPLLKGAMLVYLVLAATAYMKNGARTLTLFVLWAWYWTDLAWKAETFQTMILWGVILCDLGSNDEFQDFVARYPRARRVVQTVLIALGLWVGSYPEGAAERAVWSQQLDAWNPYLFPDGSDVPKRWSSISWHLISVGFWLSPSLKTMFSNKLFTWLGRNSFAVYLTHGTLLRVVLVKFIYGWTYSAYSVEQKEGQDPVYHWIPRSTNWFVWALSIPTWFTIVYAVAHFWTTYVDSWCAKMTKCLEDVMFKPEDFSEKRPGLQLV